jgi:hypothetical protein
MSHGNGVSPDGGRPDPRDGQRVGLLVAAGVLLTIPIVALLWVGTYDRVEPKLGGFPFFFWYQFVWVFLCSIFTWTAFKLILAARSAHGGGGSAK